MASYAPSHLMNKTLQPVAGRHLWVRNSFPDTAEYLVNLSTPILDEIDRAIGMLRASGGHWNALEPGDMPIAGFAEIGAQLRQELTRGRGFCVICGIDAERYSRDELKAIYWAVGSYLGTLIPQNIKGDRMSTVSDLGYDPSDRNIRNSQTNREIGFHTDTVVLSVIDIVGLLCLVQSRHGGDSRLVSAAAVYNEILREMPDALPSLAHDFPIDRRTEYTAGMAPASSAPALVRDGEFARVQYNYKLLRMGAEKINHTFSGDEEQALGKINEVLTRKELVLEYNLYAGEMLFMSNDLVLHDRSRWVDDPEPAKKRHLERMWLRVH